MGKIDKYNTHIGFFFFIKNSTFYHNLPIILGFNLIHIHYDNGIYIYNT